MMAPLTFDPLVAAILLAGLAVAYLGYLGDALLAAIRSTAEAQQRSPSGPEDAAVVKELLAVAMKRAPLPADGPFLGLPPQRQFAAIDGLLAFLRGSERRRLLELAQRLGLDVQIHDRLGSEMAAERIAAIHLLDRWRLPLIVKAVAARMATDPSKAVRLEAAAALSRIEQLPAAEEVLACLEMERAAPTRLHHSVIQRLAQVEPHAIAAFSFAPPFRRIRARLIEAIGSSGELAIAPCLAVHACDKDPEVRSAALRSARWLSTPEAKGWAPQLLDDPVEAVRIQAIRCCAELGIVEARGRLADFANSASAWERMRSREALERLAAA